LRDKSSSAESQPKADSLIQTPKAKKNVTAVTPKRKRTKKVESDVESAGDGEMKGVSENEAAANGENSEEEST
jgi:hypothetical protein